MDLATIAGLVSAGLGLLGSLFGSRRSDVEKIYPAPPKPPTLPSLEGLEDWTKYMESLRGIVSGQLPEAYQNMLQSYLTSLLSRANRQVQGLTNVYGVRGLTNSGLMAQAINSVIAQAASQAAKAQTEAISDLYSAALEGLGRSALQQWQAMTQKEMQDFRNALQAWQAATGREQAIAQTQLQNVGGWMDLLTAAVPFLLKPLIGGSGNG